VRKQERNYKRGFILGGLYGLVECTSPRVLLAVARVVLAVSHHPFRHSTLDFPMLFDYFQIALASGDGQ